MDETYLFQARRHIGLGGQCSLKAHGADGESAPLEPGGAHPVTRLFEERTSKAMHRVREWECAVRGEVVRKMCRNKEEEESEEDVKEWGERRE